MLMLKDILDQVAAEIGLQMTNASSRAFAVEMVNKAAKRLYDSADLKNSLVEEIFNINVGTNVVTLPQRVGMARKMRYVNGSRPIENADPIMRYHESGANDVWPLQFRELPPTPLIQDYTNASKLTFSIPLVSTKSVTVYVQGYNENTSNVLETVTIPVGQLSASTARNYEGIRRIVASGNEEYDITVTDVAGVVLSIIPNNVKEMLYKRLQVLEHFAAPGDLLGGGQAIELLYKLALPRMEQDYDSFICGDLYDEAIAWEYIVGHHTKRTNVDGVESARAMVLKLVKNIADNVEKGKLKKFDAAPNKFLRIQQTRTINQYQRSHYGRYFR